MDIVGKRSQCVCCTFYGLSPVAFIESRATCVTTLHQLDPPETGAGTEFFRRQRPTPTPDLAPRC